MKKILLGEMYDGYDADLQKLGYDAQSVVLEQDEANRLSSHTKPHQQKPTKPKTKHDEPRAEPHKQK